MFMGSMSCGYCVGQFGIAVCVSPVVQYSMQLVETCVVCGGVWGRAACRFSFPRVCVLVGNSCVCLSCCHLL